MYKVLIIEDEEMIRKGLRYTFDWLKWDCVVIGEAENGQEGLEKISEYEPDVILLDVSMPIMDGITMLENYSGNPSFSVIIISGYDEFDFAKKAIRLGVSEYLLKPVDHRQLFEAVYRAKEQAKLKSEYNTFVNKEKEIKVPLILDFGYIEDSVKTSPYVRKMVNFIQEEFHKKISIVDLVGPLDRSTTYLNQKFKNETTYTFNDFLNRYRVQKAVEYMKKGNMKICNIAEEVGFSNYRYFISVFKKYAGCLPSDFVEHFSKMKDGYNWDDGMECINDRS